MVRSSHKALSHPVRSRKLYIGCKRHHHTHIQKPNVWYELVDANQTWNIDGTQSLVDDIFMLTAMKSLKNGVELLLFLLFLLSWNSQWNIQNCCHWPRWIVVEAIWNGSRNATFCDVNFPGNSWNANRNIPFFRTSYWIPNEIIETVTTKKLEERNVIAKSKTENDVKLKVWICAEIEKHKKAAKRGMKRVKDDIVAIRQRERKWFNCTFVEMIPICAFFPRPYSICCDKSCLKIVGVPPPPPSPPPPPPPNENEIKVTCNISTAIDSTGSIQLR